MKKILLLTLGYLSFALANSIGTTYTYKNYNNSTSKTHGQVIDVFGSIKVDKGKFYFNMEDNKVKREHFKTKKSLKTLRSKKIGVVYQHNINTKNTLFLSTLDIDDNISPTDNGTVFGLGLQHKLQKGLKLNAHTYLSDYQTFNVQQYNLAIQKGFAFDSYSLLTSLGVEHIKINGEQYGAYSFEDKNYTTGNIKLIIKRKPYYALISTVIGKRAFAVKNKGLKIQHHAMEQSQTYMFKIGKKFKSWDLGLKYVHMKNKELPQNQSDVRSNFYTIQGEYKF